MTYTPFLLFASKLSTKNWFHSLTSQRFQILLTLFSKSFSPFPHGTCSLSVSDRYLALEENYLPISAPSPKYATLCNPSVHVDSQCQTGLSPSLMQFSSQTYIGFYIGEGTKDYNSQCDLQLELFPVHSPLLRESYSFSFPPLTYMLKFSG